MLPLVVIVVLALALLVSGLIFALLRHRVPPIANPPDIFGFAQCVLKVPPALPAVQRYPARDGEPLAFRFYDSTAAKLLILVHGSSYHGAAYHELAQALSTGGAAKVILPNLRGHFLSGRKHGDVDYVGQLEDDLADLIAELRRRGHSGPVFLGGHSSGGGFALRVAGGRHAALVTGYLLLAPVIPYPPFMRNGSAGGWCNVNLPRIVGLTLLNLCGIRTFNEMEVINFNKPAEYRDGTETLAYSYNLNTSYHPRHHYRSDLRALQRPTLVLIGTLDQAIEPAALQSAFAQDAASVDFRQLEGIDHFGVITAPAATQAIQTWLHG